MLALIIIIRFNIGPFSWQGFKRRIFVSICSRFLSPCKIVLLVAIK
uniref:Uncharacterized protein n=1 Tax=Anguilla anguilla TaxID=7936 RepID=A0A0E9X270_ANGAN